MLSVSLVLLSREALRLTPLNAFFGPLRQIVAHTSGSKWKSLLTKSANKKQSLLKSAS